MMSFLFFKDIFHHNFQRLKYLHQVSLGLSYLAGMKIYHGDIKLGNLLCIYLFFFPTFFVIFFKTTEKETNSNFVIGGLLKI